MTKDEFLRLLDRKLDVINERERRDIIDEYRTHIEMKMKEGKSEEEAIEDFGNIDELVDDILDAYKINTDCVNRSFDTKLNRFMDDLFNGFQRFLGSFTSLQMDDVVRLVFEILVILILLAVLHIPFRMILLWEAACCIPWRALESGVCWRRYGNLLSVSPMWQSLLSCWSTCVQSG